MGKGIVHGGGSSLGEKPALAASLRGFHGSISLAGAGDARGLGGDPKSASAAALSAAASEAGGASGTLGCENFNFSGVMLGTVERTVLNGVLRSECFVCFSREGLRSQIFCLRKRVGLVRSRRCSGCP